MEMKVNCKTVIFNDLQLYETNCNDIKKRKSSCRNVGFNMLNPLSLFLIFLFFKIVFIKLLLLFVLLKLYQENFIFYSLLFRDILCLYKTLFLFFFFFVIGFTLFKNQFYPEIRLT